MRRRYMDDWELRDERFEELEDSEGDDGHGHGVLLDPYAARDARARGGFTGDELYFDGYDIGRDRHSRRALYDRDLDSQELELRDQRGMAFYAAVREKEAALVDRAKARIERARAKGQTNISLSVEEIEALERRNNQQPEPAPLASPPPTPAKTGKSSKVGSRSNSSTNLASQKNKKKGSSSTAPAKSNSKAKVSRKSSAEQQASQPQQAMLPYPTGAPGIMVPGPDGVPVYAPIGYGPPSPDFRRTTFGGTSTSQPTSRSASKHNRRESTPPERSSADPYANYPLRYYPPQGMRPPSSSSNRSLPDDIDWHPPAPRTRSASNAQYAGYDVSESGPLALPAAQSSSSRRNVSGPPLAPGDMRYSSLRRVPAGSSPLAGRPGPGYASYSDPTMVARTNSGLRRELGEEDSSSESSDSSEDEGVQVEILPDDAEGYTVARTSGAGAAAGVAVSGNEGRKRKGKR